MSLYEYPLYTPPEFMRSIELGGYSVRTSELSNSALTYLGSERGKVTLKLEYRSRQAEDVKIIIDFYRTTRGTLRSFSITPSMWRHGVKIADQIAKLNNTNLWRFNKAITVNTQFRGIYDFDVEVTSINSPTFTPSTPVFPCKLV
jgi:hypothetical protein